MLPGPERCGQTGPERWWNVRHLGCVFRVVFRFGGTEANWKRTSHWWQSFATIRSENSVFPREEALSCSRERPLKVSLLSIGKESLSSKVRTHEKMSTFTIVWMFYWWRAVQLSCFIQNHSFCALLLDFLHILLKGKADFCSCEVKPVVPSKNVLSLYPCLRLVVLSVVTYLLFCFLIFTGEPVQLMCYNFMPLLPAFGTETWHCQFSPLALISLYVCLVEKMNGSNNMTTVGCNQIFKNRCILKICTFCMHA